MSSTKDPNSSKEIGEEGNTSSPPLPRKKQCSPAVRWCFTLNHWTAEELGEFQSAEFLDKCERVIIGKEGTNPKYGKDKERRARGEGTPHLQGFVRFKTKRRPLSTVMGKRAKWIKCDGNDEHNYNYCTKEHDIALKYGKWKTPVRTILEEDMYDWQKEIVALFKDDAPWDDRAIYWYHGGYKIGKSQFTKFLCHHMGAVKIGGEGRHMLAQAYKADAPIYIVELAKGDNKISYRALEQIKDGCYAAAFGTECNGMVVRNAPHILVIGNEQPDTKDRNYHPDKYRVFEVREGEAVRQ